MHIIIGPPHAVDLCRLELHRLGYAVRAAFPKEMAGAWSHPVKTVNLDAVLRTRHPSEVMRVLGKRLTGTQGASPERSV
ncbi:MAG: hypothetical protein AAF289_10385 [Cyanobacteria bacterium P01_A01_bin.135]